MKTIAISIDETMLRKLRLLATAPAHRDPTMDAHSARRSISELIREAVRDYLERCERQAREAHDRRVIETHRDLLDRQCRALVKDQAEA